MAKNKRAGTIKLRIGEDSFFANGRIVLGAIDTLEDHLRNALSSEVRVKLEDRQSANNDDRIGVEADSLNYAIRNVVRNIIGDINEETYVKNGVFFQAGGNKGFDFALYDEDYNIARLFNYYVGQVGILDGDNKIKEIYKKLNLRKRDWINKISDLYNERGAETGDLLRVKNKLTVVGEIQFGNWALAYRDLFRLLNADYDPGVDLYIYITSSGQLKSMISKQTVSYESFVRIIEENANLLRVPMWIIGLDIEKYTESLLPIGEENLT